MDELRENCPWDKKQTIESLRHLTIEETFELSDAIVEQDMYPAPFDKPLPIARRTREYLRGIGIG